MTKVQRIRDCRMASPQWDISTDSTFSEGPGVTAEVGAVEMQVPEAVGDCKDTTG